MAAPSTAAERPRNSSNRLGLDYEAEASRFPRPETLGVPHLVDMHTHVHGHEATRLYARACALYGVGRVYSMTWRDELETVRAAAGDLVRFIAMPSLKDMAEAAGRPDLGLVDQVASFHAAGARMLKFWAAPRCLDFLEELGIPEAAPLDSAPRRAAMDAAHELGMMFMVHVADPDTWFATTYADASRYRRKADHYGPLERLLDAYDVPWIAAHMGGSPEDLDRLDGLLERHPNLFLDTSAAKWMIRELSRTEIEDPGRLRAFLERHRDRILFGTDVVTTDDHLTDAPGDNPMHAKASTPEEAFDLYASRLWALRTLFETDHDGESPIADPDLAMVEPDRYDPSDAPPLRGLALPRDLLRRIYHDNAARVLDAWYDRGEVDPPRDD